MTTNRIIPKWGTDAKPEPDSKNKVFCMAPWTHTYLSPQGERRLCCASREEHSFQKQYIDSTNDEKYGVIASSKTDVEDFNPVSLKDHWNSPYMRDIRIKLMAGEEIPQCDVCNKNLLMEGESYRGWFTGALFKDKIQEAFNKTDDTGHTTMEPISFDYRFSNLCNFKCRMCGEQLSSSWEAEKKKLEEDILILEAMEQDPGVLRTEVRSLDKRIEYAHYEIDKRLNLVETVRRCRDRFLMIRERKAVDVNAAIEDCRRALKMFEQFHGTIFFKDLRYGKSEG